MIATAREIMEDNDLFFGSTTKAQVDQMRSISKLLEGLLVGLVPIRGWLVDFVSVQSGGREFLVHKRLLETVPEGERPIGSPVLVVGVAQRDLFWKDIRRILFSRSKYRVFCRLATDGVSDGWSPVKVADVLAGIAPEFDEAITEFGQTALQAMKDGAAASRSPAIGFDGVGENMVIEFAQELVGHHDGELDMATIKALVQDIPFRQGWFKTVDSRRPVLAEVIRRVDNALGVKTPSELAADLRMGFTRKIGASDSPGLGTPTGFRPRSGSVSNRRERFLDAEIIAVYW